VSLRGRVRRLTRLTTLAPMPKGDGDRYRRERLEADGSPEARAALERVLAHVADLTAGRS
jgi:hypothetical protein